MPDIALDTIKSLVHYLSLCGIKREVALAHINLTEQQLNSSRRLIDTASYEALYQLAEAHLKNTDLKNIGFEFGQSIEADRWGILGYIAFTSPTLKAALGNQRKYQSLVGNVGTPLMALQQDELLLKWIPAYRCSRHTVEEIISGWTAMARKLSTQTLRPLMVYFAHPCHGNIDDYTDFFDCEVLFDSDFNGIKINRSVLDHPLVKHDPEIHHLLCQHADKVINNLAKQLPVEIITQFIRNQLPDGVPEIEDAAQNLQLSVRTLQRKLSDHQLTFSGLIDSIRKDLAISYLRHTNTRVIYIAQMLGFSEQSAFARAFKRWTQQTPKQFRDKSKEQS